MASNCHMLTVSSYYREIDKDDLATKLAMVAG